MNPYDESLVYQTNAKVKALYVEAAHPMDAQYPVWIARTVYDYCAGMSWSASEAKHLGECRQALGLVDPLPPVQTLPRLRVTGQFFGLETGARWTAIECSDFNLLNRWQHGEDVYPILEQRSAAGFNLLRVWTLYDLSPGIGTFLDLDYARIPAFLADCSRYGLYVEFTAYTSLERPDHWPQLVAACQGCRNVLLELVNEGTLPVNQINMGRYARPAGVLSSHGSGGSEGVPPWEPWDYATYHTNGAFEEQRKIGHNAMSDLADVFHVPTVTNETSRYPDVGMWMTGNPVTLDRQKALAFDSAAGAALLCAGACFHSVEGKTSVLWDAAHLAVAEAWAAGAKSISLLCQPGTYYHRIDLETGDLLRVYQRGTVGCLAKIRK